MGHFIIILLKLYFLGEAILFEQYDKRYLCLFVGEQSKESYFCIKSIQL